MMNSNYDQMRRGHVLLLSDGFVRACSFGAFFFCYYGKSGTKGSKEILDFVVKELQQAAPLLSEVHSNLLGRLLWTHHASIAYFLLAKLAPNAEAGADNDWTDGVRPDGKNLILR